MEELEPTPVFLTADDLCELLSISRRTVRYWVSNGMLPPPWRLGPDGRTLRWHRQEVMDFLSKARGGNAA